MSHIRTACAVLLAAIILTAGTGVRAREYERDTIPTTAGPVTITFLGHGTMMASFDSLVVHLDPWSQVTDYAALPKADVVLITHDHIDHLDPAALDIICTPDTRIVYTAVCATKQPGGSVMANGDSLDIARLAIRAVPMHNIVGGKYRAVHPGGAGNGYVVTFGGVRFYFMGETDVIGELAGAGPVDIAFMAADGVYNLDAADAARAARIIRPRILYPIHTGDLDPHDIATLLADDPAIEVRIREMR